MAVETRNIVADGPDIFRDNFIIDASPIYQTISADIQIISSGFSEGNIDWNAIGSSHSFDPLERTGLRDLNTPLEFENVEIVRQNSANSFYDSRENVDIVSAPSGKFLATPSVVDIAGDFLVSPYSPPGFLPNAFFHRFTQKMERVNNAVSPPTSTFFDILSAITTPIFTGSIRGGDLKMVVSLELNYASFFPPEIKLEIDASGWGSPELRDIRGTYNVSGTDENGIQISGSVTIA